MQALALVLSLALLQSFTYAERTLSFTTCVSEVGNSLYTAGYLLQCCAASGADVMPCVLDVFDHFQISRSLCDVDTCGNLKLQELLKYRPQFVGTRTSPSSLASTHTMGLSDSAGVQYLAATNGVVGQVDFVMIQVPPLKKYKPADVFLCEILRTSDSTSYVESNMVVTMGPAIDSSAPVVFTFKYSGVGEISVPMFPGVPASFQISSNLEYFIAANANSYDVVVTSDVKGMFEAQSGKDTTIANFCNNSAILGKAYTVEQIVADYFSYEALKRTAETLPFLYAAIAQLRVERKLSLLQDELQGLVNDGSAYSGVNVGGPAVMQVVKDPPLEA